MSLFKPWNHIGARLASEWVHLAHFCLTVLTEFSFVDLDSFLFHEDFWVSVAPKISYLETAWWFWIFLLNQLVVDSNQLGLSWFSSPSESLLTTIYFLFSAPLRGSVPFSCNFFSPAPGLGQCSCTASDQHSGEPWRLEAPLYWCSALRSRIMYARGCCRRPACFASSF